MKRFYFNLFSFATVLFFYFFMQGCHGRWEAPNPGKTTITISGQVTDQADGQPLDSALVKITSPSSLARAVTTDSTGAFHFKFTSEGSVTLTIQASKDGYKTKSITVDAAPGTDENGFSIMLVKSDTVNNGDGIKGPGAAAILLANKPPEFINISETGTSVSAPIIFQVIDSAGQPLTAQRAIKVQFKLVNSPGGAERLVPEIAKTDDQGKVTTTLYSGNKAGVVKLQAVVKTDQMGFEMKSSPVIIAIHGGYPDENHFSISTTTLNVDVADTSLPKINVSMGDKFSNPVAPETAVSFRASGGVIQGSANTDKNGHASVQFTSLSPRPGDGQVTVTASTVGADNQTIKKQVHLIFSTPSATISAAPNTFKIHQGENQQISYKVTDLDGNPMAAGTHIQVMGHDGTRLTGDTDITLDDYTTGGTGKTKFTFTIHDKGTSQKEHFIVPIIVTSPSGKTTRYEQISGKRVIEGSQKTGPAVIILSKKPKSAINIKATGGNVSAPITFQVKDSLGRQLTAKNAATVHFKLISQPGGADLAPHQATTNAQGEVTMTLLSGNHAGPIKVQASIKRPKYGITIYSEPVVIAIHGGYPDKNHFSITPAKHNFEGYDINNSRDKIMVVLGDKYSNPVMPGTIVYFKTTEGIIEGSATTDEDGVASVELISGDPRTADGKGVVTAITVNANDQRIQKTANIIFSTSHAIISAPPDNFTIPNGGSQSFSYSITDKHGNPMPTGTHIKVNAGKGLKLTGDVDFTLGDYLQSGANRTQFHFSAVDADKNTTEDAKVTIKITVKTPSGTVTAYSDLQGVRH